MERLLSISIILIFILTLLAACTDGGQSADATTDPVTNPTEDVTLWLTKDSTTQFSIVYAANASNRIASETLNFKNLFKEKTGVELPIVREKRDDVANDNYEIIIGSSLRPESKQIFDTLRYDDYFYGVVNNKFIIMGGSDNATARAVNAFTQNFFEKKVEADPKNISFSSSENFSYKNQYNVANATVNGVSLDNFNIVYSANDIHAAEIFAKRLRDVILEATGYCLEVKADTTATSEHEILVGNTVRTTVAFDSTSLEMKYDSGKIFFGSGYSEGYNVLLQHVKTNLFKKTDSELDLAKGQEFSLKASDVFSGGSENILNKDGSIRVLFNNIWAIIEEYAPVNLRMKQLADVYRDYAPDVIGLQEYSTQLKSLLDPMLTELGYVEVPYTNKNVTLPVATPIYYNPKTLKLIDSGFWRYNDGSGDKSKSIGWGVFEEIATGKKFCAASTHLYWPSTTEGNNARVLAARELVEQMSALSNKYDAPLIIGGDFNCDLGSEPIKIVSTGGFAAAESIAKKTELGGTHHAYPRFNSDGVCTTFYKANGTYKTAIDHIFVYGKDKLTANTYDVIEDYFALASSDHCPLLLDVTLK